MKSTKLVSFVAITAAALWAGTFAVGEPAPDANAAPSVEMKLPPGWTEADMQACIVAGTPGEMQQHLVKGAGEWTCKTTMWMAPDTEPMVSEGTMTATPVMDGRFVRCEIVGEMPGMGPYIASGIYGYDNVAKHFVSTFIDNMSTGIMTGTGSLSEDGKVLTWEYAFHCPITQKPAVMREIETITGENTKTLVAYGTDPKSGKEFKVMSIEMTRK